jgi:hypothetical protein
MQRKKIITYHQIFWTILVAISLMSWNQMYAQNSSTSMRVVEEGFNKVPDSVRIAVYWYWMSDNISVEGVQHDLEAMKKAGITRAYIGIIGGQGVPYGKTKIFTPEWWEVLHAALKKATELNIEIGMFNSPGWSQSGGPWVKPSQSMRYLAAADTLVSGGKALRFVLPQVKPYEAKWDDSEQLSTTFMDERKKGEDVKIIAYPALAKDKVQSKTWTVSKKDGETFELDMPFDSKLKARSLIIQGNGFLNTSADLFEKVGSTSRLIKKVQLSRTNLHAQTGFYPTAPIVISIPPTEGTDYKLVFQKAGDCNVTVTLSSVPKEERYPEKSLAKMFPSPNPLFNDYMWDSQPDAEASLCIDPNKVIDLTPYVKNGVLTWKAPAGKWVVSRTAAFTTGTSNGPTTPEARGLEVDKMSKQHIAEHFDAYIGEVLKKIPEADRKSFKIVVADSYEMGGQNWTDGMLDIFKATYHYDPVPYLPVLTGAVVGSPDKSDRFLWDLRRLIADKVAYDYVGGLREVSNKHGLTSWLENYGHWGFPAEFLQYGGQSNEIGGEFWAEGLGGMEVKDAASCAHIYGKPRVWAESCTAGGNAFGRYPYSLKQRIDKFFAMGVNSTLLHVYIEQPTDDKRPGFNAWFGTEFNRHNTWFSQMSTFTDYLRRTNYMLQQGHYVADVAYFIGEDAPKMAGETTPELPQGYSSDYINAEVLLKHASVKDNKLTLESGMQYRLLVLPPQKTMRPEVLSKIAELVKQGLTVVGPAPETSPSLQDYPEADTRVKSLASKMWGTSSNGMNVYGAGKVYASANLKDLLMNMGVNPDFELGGKEGASVPFIHRAMKGGDIYFVSNQTDDTLSIAPKFRVAGKVPEYWMPTTGEKRILNKFSHDGQSTTVPLTLQPRESAFIVFRQEGESTNNVESNFPSGMILSSLEGPWDVNFTKENKVITMNTLKDWTIFTEPNIRYYSGDAIYTTTFKYKGKSKGSIYLDLGKVMVMATVKLNGKDVGGVWSAPYRLNIGSYLKRGTNVLEITVVNNWKNRLIGDMNMPDKERTTWISTNPWKKDTPLQSSGLLGPVRIEEIQY